jgi:hypothetical protein
VVARLAGHPQELPLDQVATNSGERRALKVLLTHLRGAFAKRKRNTSERGAAAGGRPLSACDHVGHRIWRGRSNYRRNAPPGCA